MKYLSVFFFFLLSITANCQDAEAFYKKANDLMEKGDIQNALVEINKAIRLDSTRSIYLNSKAGILKELKKYQESYDLYSKSIVVDPANFHTYNDRGLLLLTIQEFDLAISDFSKGLSISNDTNRKVFLLNRAAAWTYKREFEQAYKDLITIYKIDSSDVGMLTNLAAICDEVGRGNETLAYLERVIKLDPKNYPAYGNMGFKYQEMGDYKKAITYFNRVLELNPDEPLGYSNRSFNKLKLGDLKGAMADIEKSIQIYPTNSYAYRIRALIYIQDNKTDKACQDLDKAIELGFTGLYGDEVQKLKTKYCSK